MQIGCGTDIIEIDRIKESIEQLGEKFINRIYTKNEIQYCESKHAQKYQHYAARFAAKEAVLKAISNHLNSKYDIQWTDIEILNNTMGKPLVNLEKIKIPELEQCDISLSHCKLYAVANVCAIFN